MPHPLATALTLLIAATAWIGTILYSRRTYFLEGCGACGSTGKDWEPLWMALCRLTLKRRWRPCPACGGAGKFDIHD